MRRKEERNENSRIRGELAAVSSLGAGRTGLGGGQGSGRLPGQLRAAKSKDGEEGVRGEKGGIVSVFLGGGGWLQK